MDAKLIRSLLPAGPGDVEDIALIDRLCFPAPWPKEDYARDLENPIATIKVVRLDERPQIVAFSHTWQMADELEILKLATHPDFQRQGHARLLLTEICRTARARKLNMVHLELRQSNRSAQRLYSSLGFRGVGERRRYYEDGEDALLMSLPLADTGDAPASS